MKVAKVALELQPCCGKRSGIGTYTYELASRLADQDEIEFCGNLFNFLGRNDNTASLEGISMSIQENRLFPYGVYRRLWTFFPIPYDMLFPKAALSIFFNFIVPPRISGKIITAIHDLTYIRFPETMDKQNLRRIQADIEDTLARTDRILTVSEFSKQEIQTLLGVPEKHISVVYNAPSFTEKAADFSDVSQKYALDRPYLLYVGNLEPRKNLPRLIEAFVRLKRAGFRHKLVLAGGNGWRQDELEKALTRLACREDVIFPGYITDGEKQALYQHAAAFVFPSLYEGFGIPPLEAMACGCPVVCSSAASLPEVVGNAASLVPPEDEQALFEAIARVLEDTAYAQSLVREGREQVKKFSWQLSAEKLMAVCKEVLAEA